MLWSYFDDFDFSQLDPPILEEDEERLLDTAVQDVKTFGTLASNETPPLDNIIKLLSQSKSWNLTKAEFVYKELWNATGAPDLFKLNHILGMGFTNLIEEILIGRNLYFNLQTVYYACVIDLKTSGLLKSFGQKYNISPGPAVYYYACRYGQFETLYKLNELFGFTLAEIPTFYGGYMLLGLLHRDWEKTILTKEAKSETKKKRNIDSFESLFNELSTMSGKGGIWYEVKETLKKSYAREVIAKLSTETKATKPKVKKRPKSEDARNPENAPKSDEISVVGKKMRPPSQDTSKNLNKDTSTEAQDNPDQDMEEEDVVFTFD